MFTPIKTYGYNFSGYSDNIEIIPDFGIAHELNGSFTEKVLNNISMNYYFDVNMRLYLWNT